MHICSLCGKLLHSEGRLTRHVLACHSDHRPYVCLLCDKAFRRKDRLLFHSRTHTGEKPFTCDQCDYAALSRTAIRKHQIGVHTRREDWSYNCQQCTLTFPTQMRLTAHMKTHTREGYHKCDFCEKSFRDKIMKRDHIGNIHSSDQVRWQCVLCEKTLASERGLKKHSKYWCQGNRKPGEGNSRAKKPTQRRREIKTVGKKSVPRRRKPRKTGSKSASGVKTLTLTCRLCEGEFESLPDMYKHQCPVTPSS